MRPHRPRQGAAPGHQAAQRRAGPGAHRRHARPLPARATLGAGCGLRVGEVLGLRIRSVRIEEAELAVVEQLQLLPGSPPVLRPPKTASSIRVVPLPQVVADAVVLHLQQWPGEDEDLLLRGRNGSYLWPNTFNDNIWRGAARRAGQPAARFHELRHFYASALIRAGESVKTVQAALGHASAVETLETYAGLWPDSQARTRAAVDDLGLRSQVPAGPGRSDTAQRGLVRRPTDGPER